MLVHSERSLIVKIRFHPSG